MAEDLAGKEPVDEIWYIVCVMDPAEGWFSIRNAGYRDGPRGYDAGVPLSRYVGIEGNEFGQVVWAEVTDASRCP